MNLKSMMMGACLAALALAALAMTAPTAALAEDPEVGNPTAGVAGADVNESCKTQAAAKELSGAEKDSFIEKCVKHPVLRAPPGRIYLLQPHDSNPGADVNESCKAQAAANNKLSGAEKDSFIEKCVKDAAEIGGSLDLPPTGR